ncbi:MAG: glycosyltransferase family 2 protein [Chitinophagales bacterium]|nr:glycosyltransferase family 2 protein [Chitinophagales bacterium]HRN94546.1 glycosyltransferase family A protein [Chitinophagales bacterium]
MNSFLYMEEPLVSIVIPVFNRAHLVFDALDSVLSQTYSNWECIVVDDGSTDNTWEVIKCYAKKDSRIKIFKRDRLPKGAPTCRNIGVEKSSADYIIFLDSDDILFSFCLEKRMEFVYKNPNFDLVFFQVFGNRNKQFKYRTIYKVKDIILSLLSFESTLQTTSPIWQKELLQKINGWDEEALAWQDPEIHVRALLAAKSYCWAYELPDVYIRNPTNNKSITSSNSAKKHISILKTQYKIWQKLPVTYKETFRKKIITRLYNQIEILEQEIGLKLISDSSTEILELLGKSAHTRVNSYFKLFHITKRIPVIRSIVFKLRTIGIFFPKRIYFESNTLVVSPEIIAQIELDKNAKYLEYNN